MSTKKRGTNFSSTEKLLLIEIITQYKHIIENKKTDKVFSKEKGKCWKEISKRFSSESSVFRDILTLKNCWENLKKKTRKYYAEKKSKLYKTGGGPCETQHDPIMEKMYCIIKPSVDGLNNEFDNDSMESNVYLHHGITNSDSDCNSNVLPIGELLEEHILSDEEEDSIIKHIKTMQDTSGLFPIIADIDKNKCIDMERNVFDREIPLKQNIARGVNYKSQVQSIHGLNKNNVCKQNRESVRPECTAAATNEQDVIIDCNSSTTIPKMANSKQEMGKNTNFSYKHFKEEDEPIA